MEDHLTMPQKPLIKKDILKRRHADKLLRFAERYGGVFIVKNESNTSRENS